MNKNFALMRMLRAASLGCGTPLAALIIATTFGMATNTAGAQESSATIEEIIVVVTRREASVQDIPVAVTAVTGSMLVDSGVEDVYMLQEQAPGLVSQSQPAVNHGKLRNPRRWHQLAKLRA